MTRDQWCAISWMDRHASSSDTVSDLIKAIGSPQIEIHTEKDAFLFYRVYRRLKDSERKFHLPGVTIILNEKTEKVMNNLRQQFEWIRWRESA